MKFLLLALALALPACSTAPQTPAQGVYAATSSYEVALNIAVAYKNLPPCGTSTSPVLCSQATVITQLQAADTAASATLATAQTIVRTPGAGANVQTAIAAANAAVALLTQITSNLKVK